MVAAIEFEQGVTSASIFGIVIGKFSHQQQPCPIILLQIHECFEVHFYRAVLSFDLACHDFCTWSCVLVVLTGSTEVSCKVMWLFH